MLKLEVRKLRFILNTFYSGPQAWFFVADDLGFFAQEGLEIEFTQGDTLANAVPKIASGAFEVGYGDMNALIEMQAAAASAGEPARDVVAVLATFNQCPYTIAVPKTSPITTPQQLANPPLVNKIGTDPGTGVGASLGSHPNDAALRMLPEFALACGVDAPSLQPELSSLPHSEMVRLMVREGRWRALFGFVNTLEAAAIESGVGAGQLRHFEFRHHVPSLYGAAVMVSRTLAADAPEVVSGLVRAISKGIAVVMSDTDAATDAVVRRNPQLDRAANKARLEGTLKLEMAQASAQVGTKIALQEEGHIGSVDSLRLAQSMALICKAKGYAVQPKVGDIFDARFLPPLNARPKAWLL